MSLDSLPPGATGAGSIVTRKVFLNGTELSASVSLQQITVSKAFNKIAWARLLFIDGSVSDRDFALSNEDQFKPGTEIKVEMGYDGDVETIFEGIIICHAIKVRSSGPSQLTIEAKDKAIKLTGARESNYFIDKKDSEVIEELAGDLQPDVEATTVTHKQLVQFEATKWDFILTRAEANSMLVLTDDNKLLVKKPATMGAPVLTATYGDNMYEFDAEMDARRQVQSIATQGWDYTQQTAEQVSSGNALFTEAGNIASDELGAVLGTALQMNHSGYLTQPQLQSWADAHALRNKLGKIAGRVRIIGTATVKPGDLITLDGVGDRFNGNVLVTGVLHLYDGFWQTDIQFGWKEEWFYKKEGVMEKPAAGLLPGINGLQIGTVLSSEDTEQGGQFRVKVHMPGISTSDGIWARMVMPDAGPERGFYFRPQENDEVVLGFLSDDPREPVILGCLHSKDANQTPFPSVTSSQQEFGIVTKEKIKISLDDTNKKLTISVPVSEGQEKTIVLNDGGAMELKDENSNSIKMDASGITIQAGTGKNVTIKGTQVLIN